MSLSSRGQGIDGIVKDGKAAAGHVADLARSSVCVIFRKGAVKPDISTLDALKRTLLAAKSITYLAIQRTAALVPSTSSRSGSAGDRRRGEIEDHLRQARCPCGYDRCRRESRAWCGPMADQMRSPASITRARCRGTFIQPSYSPRPIMAGAKDVVASNSGRFPAHAGRGGCHQGERDGAGELNRSMRKQSLMPQSLFLFQLAWARCKTPTWCASRLVCLDLALNGHLWSHKDFLLLGVSLP